MVPIKRFKRLTVTLSMMVIGRALQTASRVDPDVMQEIGAWPEGFTAMMHVVPCGPKLGWVKQGRRLYCLGTRIERADLEIHYKNVECAFLLFAGLKGPDQACAEHRLAVRGDLTLAMSFIRCIKLVLAYLFPRPISRRLLKRVPPMGLRRQIVRILIYGAGIPFGI